MAETKWIKRDAAGIKKRSRKKDRASGGSAKTFATFSRGI